MLSRMTTALAAVGAAALLGGCSFANPITTQMEYAPSDGVRVELAENVSFENLMILAPTEDAEGHLLGGVVNNSQTDVTAEITLEGGPSFEFDLGAGDEVNFTDAGLTPASVDAPPGATLPAEVSAPGLGAELVQIPVLDGTLPAYERYLERH